MNDNYKEIVKNIASAVLKFADYLDSFSKWYQENKYIISSYLQVFVDLRTWYLAVEKMAENQIVFTDDLTVEFSNKIYESNNVNQTIYAYYFDNGKERISQLIERCQKAQLLDKYKILLHQTIEAYRVSHYHLACIGLFSVLDGLMTDTTGLITTSFKRRIKVIEEKLVDKTELSRIDKKALCIYKSFEIIDKTVLGHSDFSNSDPGETVLNRHWVVHGRSVREYSEYDFLKVLLLVDSVVIASDLSE